MKIDSRPLDNKKRFMSTQNGENQFWEKFDKRKKQIEDYKTLSEFYLTSNLLMRKDKKNESSQLTERLIESVKCNTITLAQVAEINKGFKPVL